jgi:allantoicase
VSGLDLASRWFGASVLAASDESFGLKENLLHPGPSVFEPGRYDPRGEIVDGWETRRRREPGHDWALVRLGVPGAVTRIDIDTSFFTGNHPQTARVEGCTAGGYPSPAELLGGGTQWVELVPSSPLRGDAHNLFDVKDVRRFTHLRLSIAPDGGVARLRALGRAVIDPADWSGLTMELSGAEVGGRVLWSSNDFYTPAQVLVMPDRARTMGEGWETARRRDDGHDSIVIALAAEGTLSVIELDTAHFKYNASAEVAVLGLNAAQLAELQTGSPGAWEDPADAPWQPILPRTRLQPDTRHRFRIVAADVAAVRVEAFPDGGLSRVRLFGTPTAVGWADLRRRFEAAQGNSTPQGARR